MVPEIQDGFTFIPIGKGAYDYEGFILQKLWMMSCFLIPWHASQKSSSGDLWVNRSLLHDSKNKNAIEMV